MARVPQRDVYREHGIVVGLFPSTRPEYDIELARGTSTSNFARLAQLRQNQAGAKVLYTDSLPPSTTRYYYRARHTFPGFNPSYWSDIVSARPVPLSPDDIPIAAEGRRRVDTFRVADAQLRSNVQQDDGARTLPVIKSWETGQANGGQVSSGTWVDGAAVAFSANYQSAPDVQLFPRSGIVFNEPDATRWTSSSDYSGSLRQTVELYPVSVTAAGFTPRARLSQPTGSLNDASVVFQNTTMNAVGETSTANLSTNAPAYNDQYTEHYAVSLGVLTTKAAAGWFTIAVAGDSNTTGGWTERNNKNYTLNMLGSSSESFPSETMALSFSGGTSSGAVRLRIKSFSVGGMSSKNCQYTVNGSTSTGVTWQYSTASIYAPMCVAASDKVSWAVVSRESST